MPEISMPRLSDTMEEGALTEWLVGDGDIVSEGQPLAEIETDKATVVYEAESSGPVRLFVDAGISVAVGATIGWIGTDAPTELATRSSVPSLDGEATEPSARTADVITSTVVSGNGADHVGAEANTVDARRSKASATDVSARSVKISPVARRLAEQNGVVIETLAGSGPGGRISKTDVERAIASKPVSSDERAGEDGSLSADPALPTNGEQSMPLTRSQEVIARRMLESTRSVPHFDIEMDVNFDRAAQLRNELGAVWSDKPSYNDMIVKACAIALCEHRYLNAKFDNNEIRLQDAINIGVAVAAPESLLVPVVFGADRLQLAAIARETKRLALKGRAGDLHPSELTGGTFTVSNLGMYGVLAVSSIINQPQTAILGVGAIRDELARRNGEITDIRVCRLRLSCDHRVVYGAVAAEFLSSVARYLEEPLKLLA